MESPIALKWLEGDPPEVPTGVTWGVPWEQGSLAQGESVRLGTGEGRDLPVQSWPLGYWPDGSVKWTALAAVLDGTSNGRLIVEKGMPGEHPVSLTIEETPDRIRVDTGELKCEIGKAGTDLFRTILVGELEVCAGAGLVCRRERRTSRGTDSVRECLEFTGMIEKGTVEHAGPLRAVVRLEGVHRRLEDDEAFLPLVLRVYFYAGISSVRMVHTFVYDGQANTDFLAGLGLRFAVPLRDAPHNRRVWFAGDEEGVWSEPVRLVPPMLPRSHDMGRNPERPRHIGGEHLNRPGGVAAMPVWNRYSLVQDSADHFAIRKGCGAEFAQIEAHHGRRALGTAAISDSAGGLGIGIRDFWQSHPSGFTIEDAGHPERPAVVTAWLWPPETEPSDMRHYSDQMYGPMYECHNCLEWESGPFNPERSNPFGIARTSELTLWTLTGSPSRGDITAMARSIARPVLPVCDPEYYRQTGVFGVWGLPNRETATARNLEDRLDEVLDHYVKEVDRRNWYGFWNYGDFMHSYDPDRHTWRYDEGGYAWDNTECSTDIWLWYSFLRTGRADVFRLSEAMTRHTSEVDIYHLGQHAGLGGRHNVIHWGCACIEPRISMAGNRRFYYFMTGDERTGEILTETCDAWPTQPHQVQSAPWWGCFCWNWVTAWERTGDPRYRDKMLRGIEGILARKPALIAGPLFMFEPESGEMSFIEDQEPYSYHMMLPFGAPEIWMEMAQLLDLKEWADALGGYGELWAMDPEERKKLVPNGMATHRGKEITIFAARVIAYAALRKGDPDLARLAWETLLRDEFYFREAKDENTGGVVPDFMLLERDVGFTNVAAQWSLNVIECLDLIGDFLPGKENV